MASGSSVRRVVGLALAATALGGCQQGVLLGVENGCPTTVWAGIEQRETQAGAAAELQPVQPNARVNDWIVSPDFETAFVTVAATADGPRTVTAVPRGSLVAPPASSAGRLEVRLAADLCP